MDHFNKVCEDILNGNDKLKCISNDKIKELQKIESRTKKSQWGYNAGNWTAKEWKSRGKKNQNVKEEMKTEIYEIKTVQV